jgi:hypothetical protein
MRPAEQSPSQQEQAVQDGSVGYPILIAGAWSLLSSSGSLGERLLVEENLYSKQLFTAAEAAKHFR